MKFGCFVKMFDYYNFNQDRKRFLRTSLQIVAVFQITVEFKNYKFSYKMFLFLLKKNFNDFKN